MIHTFTITDDGSKQAQSIINLLETLAKDYDFIEIETEEGCTLSESLKKELDMRYQHFLAHHEEYPDWEEVKQKYLPNEN